MSTHFIFCPPSPPPPPPQKLQEEVVSLVHLDNYALITQPFLVWIPRLLSDLEEFGNILTEPSGGVLTVTFKADARQLIFGGSGKTSDIAVNACTDEARTDGEVDLTLAMSWMTALLNIIPSSPYAEDVNADITANRHNEVPLAVWRQPFQRLVLPCLKDAGTSSVAHPKKRGRPPAVKQVTRGDGTICGSKKASAATAPTAETGLKDTPPPVARSHQQDDDKSAENDTQLGATMMVEEEEEATALQLQSPHKAMQGGEGDDQSDSEAMNESQTRTRAPSDEFELGTFPSPVQTPALFRAETKFTVSWVGCRPQFLWFQDVLRAQYSSADEKQQNSFGLITQQALAGQRCAQKAGLLVRTSADDDFKFPACFYRDALPVPNTILKELDWFVIPIVYDNDLGEDDSKHLVLGCLANLKHAVSRRYMSNNLLSLTVPSIG